MGFRRGGRGGAAGGGFGGSLLFGLNPSDLGTINNENTEMPQIPFPVNGLMNTQEKEIGVNYINLNNLIRSGPFHTGDIQPESEIEKLAKDDGIQRYSDKFSKKKQLQKDKIMASINEHPYQLELFPQELYPMLKVSKKKSMHLSKLKTKDDIFMGARLNLSKNNDKDDIDIGAAFENIAENLDDRKDGEEGEAQEEEEEIDDEFDDEDDEDMDDDYNGEKYFDNGEDDDYGDDDNGDEPAF